jgi:hypothetical protein
MASAHIWHVLHLAIPDPYSLLCTWEGASALSMSLLFALLSVFMAALTDDDGRQPELTGAKDTPGANDSATPGGAIVFAGRVVDLETGQPVARASVVVERWLPDDETRGLPPWVGESTLETDPDGRFSIAFPAEQVAEPELAIALRVSADGYIGRRSWRTALAALIRGCEIGDKPFFDRVTLERGVEYTGQVVTPTGKPASDVPYQIVNWSWGQDQCSRFQDNYEGRTDAEGRFRFRTPESQALALYVTPEEAQAGFSSAPFQRFWGTAEPAKDPDVRVPTDLGTIALEPGVRLTGRVVDRDARPIAGQALRAYSSFGSAQFVQHRATTDADGRFVLGPLRAGNYTIYSEGQNGFGGVDPHAPPIPAQSRVIKPVKVYVQADRPPEPVVLHAMETIRVVVRFVDSQGRPARGSPAKLWGIVPGADPDVPQTSFDQRLASSINDPEPEDTSPRIDWAVQDRPDASGQIVLLAPRGLQEACLETYPADETIAYKTQLAPGGPLKYWGGGLLGRLDEDREITIVCFRAPTVIATVRSEDGHVPENIEVSARFFRNRASYGDNVRRHDDGRFRSESLMPECNYEVLAWEKTCRCGPTADPRSDGAACENRRPYVGRSIAHVNLPEGGCTELTLWIGKQPDPPELGKPAPGFSLETIDGSAVRLESLRGRWVLLHFWVPIPRMTGLPTLKAVHDRFGTDDRFFMLGASMPGNLADAAEVIRDGDVSLPQAILRDRVADPLTLAYSAWRDRGWFLIAPDGTLTAKGLRDDEVETAVAAALAGT